MNAFDLALAAQDKNAAEIQRAATKTLALMRRLNRLAGEATTLRLTARARRLLSAATRAEGLLGELNDLFEECARAPEEGGL